MCPSINHRFYPHIFQMILLNASIPALASMRSISREVQEQVEAILYRHVVIAPSYPCCPEIDFLSPCGGQLLPGLSEQDQEATLRRLQKHTRIVDVIRHWSDTFDRQLALGELRRGLKLAEPEWWMLGLNLDHVRMAGTRRLYDQYRSHQDVEYDHWPWEHYEEFGNNYTLEGSDTRKVALPHAATTVYFVDLIPVRPSHDLIPDRMWIATMHSRPSFTKVVNVAYEPNHPQLSAADMEAMFEPRDPAGLNTRRLVIIMTPVGPMESDDDIIKAAREDCRPTIRDFEHQCRTLHGLVWRLSIMATSMLSVEEVTVVGLELMSDDDLSFFGPERGLPWSERKRLLDARISTILRRSSAKQHFTFLARAEYKALVGDEAFYLHTAEPTATWSSPRELLLKTHYA